MMKKLLQRGNWSLYFIDTKTPYYSLVGDLKRGVIKDHPSLEIDGENIRVVYNYEPAIPQGVRKAVHRILVQHATDEEKIKAIEGIQAANIRYLETHSGIAFEADLLMDGEKIGTIANRGDGGGTWFCVPNQHRHELESRMQRYCQSLQQETITEEEFADYLIDVLEFGKVLSVEEKIKMLVEE